MVCSILLIGEWFTVIVVSVGPKGSVKLPLHEHLLISNGTICSWAELTNVDGLAQEPKSGSWVSEPTIFWSIAQNYWSIIWQSLCFCLVLSVWTSKFHHRYHQTYATPTLWCTLPSNYNNGAQLHLLFTCTKVWGAWLLRGPPFFLGGGDSLSNQRY